MSGIKIEVIGSLNPEKECQDRVRVLSWWGVCQALRATDCKNPPKVLIEVEQESDKGRERIRRSG